MRMPNPIVQLRPPATTLERVLRAQNFSTIISTAPPRSGGGTTETGVPKYYSEDGRCCCSLAVPGVRASRLRTSFSSAQRLARAASESLPPPKAKAAVAAISVLAAAAGWDTVKTSKTING